MVASVAGLVYGLFMSYMTDPGCVPRLGKEIQWGTDSKSNAIGDSKGKCLIHSVRFQYFCCWFPEQLAWVVGWNHYWRSVRRF